MSRWIPVALTSLMLLALLPTIASAQPIMIPDTELVFPLPESGRWGPRDGSRTGLFLEVQNRIIAGIWIGYDADGNPLWLSFNGTLAPWQDAFSSGRTGWELIGRLTRFSGGGCILIGEECDGSVAGTPDNEKLPQWIRLRFSQRSAVTLEVLPPGPEIGTPPPGTPSGPFPADEPVFGPIELVPLYFGVDSVNLNPTRALERIPDLEGTWLAVNSHVILDQIELTFGPIQRERPRILKLGPGVLTGYALTIPVNFDLLGEIRYPILSDSSGPVDPQAEVWCETRFFESDFFDPGFFTDCGIDGIEGAGFPADPAAISDARIDFIKPPFDIVIGAPGGARYDRLTLFRLDHD